MLEPDPDLDINGIWERYLQRRWAATMQVLLMALVILVLLAL